MKGRTTARMTSRTLAAAALLLVLPASPAVAAPPASPSTPLAPAERAAVFQAAGFKPRGEQWIRCEEDPPTASYQAGSIEVADLNGDGSPEAWVKESSTFCYGHTAEAFVLLTREKDGTWRRILEAIGVPVVRDTRNLGWPDVEVGGPGFGASPVHRWDGTRYAAPR